MKITRHAIERYQERVANVSDDDVRSRILEHSRALMVASAFGAPVVRLADGVRLMVKDGVVTTVLGTGMRLGPV